MIATAPVATGVAAFASQILLMGRADPEGNSAKLRRFHRRAGRTFVALVLPLAFLGAGFQVGAGFHVVLAPALAVLVLLKIRIVRVYRGFLWIAPTPGMTVFALSAVFSGLTIISR